MPLRTAKVRLRWRRRRLRAQTGNGTLYPLNRVTQAIQDDTAGTPGNTNDVATEYGYDGDNNTLYVQADEPGGVYQRTAYVYGVTTASGSGVNSNDILSAVQYPDPTTHSRYSHDHVSQTTSLARGILPIRDVDRVSALS